jgi:HlyD family secretion protein
MKRTDRRLYPANQAAEGEFSGADPCFIDRLRRVDVTAPVEGTVQSLKVFTIGQVIRPGEPLLDIVPKNERLNIEVEFSPNDIDGVLVGQQAEIRFPAFHSRTIPLFLGRLETVSLDRLVDEATKQPYYRGIVGLDSQGCLVLNGGAAVGG